MEKVSAWTFIYSDASTSEVLGETTKRLVCAQENTHTPPPGKLACVRWAHAHPMPTSSDARVAGAEEGTGFRIIATQCIMDTKLSLLTLVLCSKRLSVGRSWARFHPTLTHSHTLK